MSYYLSPQSRTAYVDLDVFSTTKFNYFDNAEYLMMVMIGVVYACLVMQIVDKRLGYDTVKNNVPGQCTPENMECKQKRLNNMLIAGGASLLIGGYLSRMGGSTCTCVMGYGVALGGVLSIVSGLVGREVGTNRDLRILVLAVLLAGLCYGSTRMF